MSTAVLDPCDTPVTSPRAGSCSAGGDHQLMEGPDGLRICRKCGELL